MGWWWGGEVDRTGNAPGRKGRKPDYDRVADALFLLRAHTERSWGQGEGRTLPDLLQDLPGKSSEGRLQRRTAGETNSRPSCTLGSCHTAVLPQSGLVRLGPANSCYITFHSHTVTHYTVTQCISPLPPACDVCAHTSIAQL